MDNGFDRGAAVTRSLLGYGVLAGAFYLVFGLTLALTRDGFDLGEHALSLLMLGEHGWLQSLNLSLSGVMVLIAAAGFARALDDRRVAILVAGFGACLIAGAIFEPDPANGFPVPTPDTEATLSGILHLAFGAVGFFCLAAAAFLSGSRPAAATIVIAFLAGAALATTTAGVLLLWIAVVAGWLWLAGASIAAYRAVPHPDAHRRA